MLISVAIANHRSIRERVELSLVAEANPTSTERVEIHVPSFDLTLVPVVGLVGANGSGKSNVVDALAYVSEAVAHSQTRWEPDAPPPRVPFMTKAGPLEEPSEYELTFFIGGSVYEYIFRVGPRTIPYERLAVARRGPRSWSKLFERETTPEGEIKVSYGRSLTGQRATVEAATRANSLFLSSAAQNNHAQLMEPWRWLRRAFRVATPGNREPRSVYTANRLKDASPEYRERLRKFIAGADLGIVDMSVSEVPIPEEQVNVIKMIFRAVDSDDVLPPDDQYVTPRTTFMHRGDVGPLELEDESAGTRAWFEWAAPVLDALDAGQVFAADELDAHLNSALAAEIVRAFQGDERNRNSAQLLFNAQDPALLSATDLARDQVWITEKGPSGATVLIPVTDFHARRQWDVGQAYRHGRFGGLPVVDENALTSALAPGDNEPHGKA